MPHWEPARGSRRSDVSTMIRLRYTSNRSMTADKIVLITMPYDQVDILSDFLDWHLDLGIDLILALDGGSTDGTRDVLDKFTRDGTSRLVPAPRT